ncbi:hypothetical protein BH11ARM2_BH11ARM2_21030 [soil metagenome]
MATIRRAGTKDLPVFIELWREVWPSRPRSLEEMLGDIDRLPAHQQGSYWLAYQDHEPVGYAEIEPLVGSAHADMLEIGVLPAFRRQGIGAALLEAVKGHGQGEAFARIWETDADSLRFAEKRGFAERKRDFMSRLEVADAPKELLRQWEKAIPGIEIPFMKEVDSEPFRRALHALFEIVRIDIPRAVPPEPLTFEFFDEHVLGDPEFRWDASSVALSEGRPIGFSGLYNGIVEGSLDQWLTAVHPSWRGQGIAQALKAKGIRWAQEHGYASIQTDNDSRNAPMLGINRKLGFIPQPALISMALLSNRSLG